MSCKGQVFLDARKVDAMMARHTQGENNKKLGRPIENEWVREMMRYSDDGPSITTSSGIV